MGNKYVHFRMKVFRILIVCAFIITVFATSVFVYNYVKNEEKIMNYSLSVTSEFVNERIAGYRMRMISLFASNVANLIEYSGNDIVKTDAVEDVFSNIYAENNGIQFIYYIKDGDSCSIGEGIGDIEQRNEIFGEFNKFKKKHPDQQYWKYMVDDKGGDCIIFCRDIIYLTYDYKKKNIGTVCVGLNIRDLNSECFDGIQFDNSYVCNQFITDLYGTIVFATDETLIGKKISSIYDENKSTICGKRQVVCLEKGTDWSLITYVKGSVGNLFSRRIFAVIILVGIIISLCMIVIISLASKRAAKPLEDLYEYVDNINVDDINMNIRSAADNTEIGKIADKFNNVLENLEEKIKNEYKLQLELKDARLKLYESQMNPHFLYNTLQLIQMMSIMDEKENVCKVVSSLSQMLDFSLENENEIRFEEELDNIENYFNIIMFRYKDKFNYSMIVDENVKECYTIKFLIQPFVENAIKYGFKNKKSNWEIGVLVRKVGSEIVIVVEDNGDGFEPKKLRDINYALKNNIPDESLGKGIWNIHSMLKLKYGKEYGISLYRFNGKTQVVVNIPYILYKNDGGGNENL